VARHNRGLMCARYDSVLDAARLKQFFNVRGLRDLVGPREVFPGSLAPLIRRPTEYACGDEAVPSREILTGHFGLLPHWAKDHKLARSTYNASGSVLTVRWSSAATTPRHTFVSLGGASSASGPHRDRLRWSKLRVVW
jgi:putative SOS response-associated peptidase YedK